MSSEITSVVQQGMGLTTFPGMAMAPRYTLHLRDIFGQAIPDQIYGTGVCCTLPAMWPAGSIQPYARAQGQPKHPIRNPETLPL